MMLESMACGRIGTLALLFVSLFASLWALPVFAQVGEGRDETERWVPALSVSSGVLVQEADGSVVSSLLLGPGAGEARNNLSCERTLTQLFRCADTGDDTQVTPFVDFSAELMTPGIQSWAGRPRLFVRGGAGPSFGFKRDVAKEGVPGEFTLPDNLTPLEIATQGYSVIGGQGSKSSIEIESLLVTAGAGVAFTFEVGERRLRLKPSFEYLRQKVELTGISNRVVQVDANPNPNCGFPGSTPDLNAIFRCESLRGSESQVFHGIGPGLEVETDTVRAGPFVMTVFLAGQAYAFLGDLDLQADARNEFGERSEWGAELERWAFRGGVGLRFRWLPD
ncbi:MAG: hypothetical protein QNK04_21465 [Myxococcota bacterium]|nr:hypothetical protein [Myxococcota bacterium]